jgi:hypothetical protein
MESNLARMQRTLPRVVQFNKRDLPSAIDVDILKTALRLSGERSFEAVALTGAGVPQTLHGAMRVMLLDVQKKLNAARASQGGP